MSAWLEQAALWTWQNSLAAALLALAILSLRRGFHGRVAPLWLCLAGWLVMARLVLPSPLPHAWAWDRLWKSPPPVEIPGTPPIPIPGPGPASAAAEQPEVSMAEIAALRLAVSESRKQLEIMRDSGYGPIHPGVVSLKDKLETDLAKLESPLPPSTAPSSPLQAAPPFPWFALAAWIWLGGAAAALLLTLLRHHRFSRRLDRSAVSVALSWPRLAGECAAAAGLRRPPPLFSIPGGGTPFLLGTLRPRIVIPAETLAALSPEEARHVLLHEMLHVVRRDLAANWLLAVLRALHWFNPLVHAAARHLLADREMLRDRQVITLLRDPSAGSAYGHTLLKLALPAAAPAPSPGLAPLFHSEKELKRRLIMIQLPPSSRRLAATAAAVSLTCLSLPLFTTASAQQTPAATPEAPSAPAAPAAPAPPADPAAPVAAADPAQKEAAKEAPSPAGPETSPDTGSLKKLQALNEELQRHQQAALAREREARAQLEKAAQFLSERNKALNTGEKRAGDESAEAIRELRAEVANLHAAVKALRKENMGTKDWIARQMAETMTELGSLSKGGLGPAHPKMKSLHATLAELQKTAEALDHKEEKRRLENDLRAKEAAHDAEQELRRAKEENIRQRLLAEEAKREAEQTRFLAARTAKEAALKERMAAAEAARAAEEARLREAVKQTEIRPAKAVENPARTAENLPWGVAVPGRPGLVYTPFSPDSKIVDVSKFKKGDKVTCPYSDNFFQVPATAVDEAPGKTTPLQRQ